LVEFEISLDEKIIQLILEAAPVGLCVTDETGTFVAVNKAYTEIYGYEPEEMIGKSFLLVVKENDQDRLKKLHDNFIKGLDELDAFWTVLRKDGKQINIKASARRFKNKEGKFFKLTMVQDITQLKLLERRKQITDKILFKEIVQSLQGLKQTIANFDWSIILQKSPIDYPKEIQDVFASFETRLNNLKDITEIMTGQFVPRLSEFFLSDLFEKSLFKFYPMVQKNRLRLDFLQKDETLGETCNFKLRSDFDLLRATLENLVKNAVEASPPDAVVRVHAKKIKNRFLIEVGNMGEIPDEIKNKFFQPYNTTKSYGTGLGAYSAKIMVEVLGGTINMTSQDGQTTLLISFPIDILCS